MSGQRGMKGNLSFLISPRAVSSVWSITGSAVKMMRRTGILSTGFTLRDRPKAVKQLNNAGLDNGIACETIDPHTGWVKTGAAFATCAGFLAYSFKAALEE